MNERGVAISYGDIAVGAKEEFVAVAPDKEPFVKMEQFQVSNLDFNPYENPCELYAVLLDGGALPFPDNPDEKYMGLWSESISGEDGTFENPIVITLTSANQYESQGLTLHFDKYNNGRPNNLNIHWYRDVEGRTDDLGGMDFHPNSSMYFCRNHVSNYNRIVITFYDWNFPYSRLKLQTIDYGYGTVFYGKELRSVKLIQQLDPISSEISINTTDFTIDSKGDMVYSFQDRQPLSTYFNGKLLSTTFVKSSTRSSRFLWDVKSEDYIGLMEDVPYFGDVYVDKDAVELMEDIFYTAKVPYNIDDAFNGMTVSGHIPYTNCRYALMQVAFAIQAVVDTSNSDVVKVYSLDDDVKQTIPRGRIMEGQSFKDSDKVTCVDITTHSFVCQDESENVQKTELYVADESGYGDNILVLFSNPAYDLNITNGEILSFSANHAIINARDECKLTGTEYNHLTTTASKKIDIVRADMAEKIVQISDATLVTSKNIDNVLEKCYNWLIKTNRTTMRIIEGKNVKEVGGAYYGKAKYGEANYDEDSVEIVTYDQGINVGEVIKFETEYLGDVTERIIRQLFNLNGGIIVKDVDVV